MEAKRHRSRWLLLAPLGLILIGAGLSMAIDAGLYRLSGADTVNWVLYGAGALIVFNVGLSFFGQAIIEKVHSDRKNQTSKTRSNG